MTILSNLHLLKAERCGEEVYLGNHIARLWQITRGVHDRAMSDEINPEDINYNADDEGSGKKRIGRERIR